MRPLDFISLLGILVAFAALLGGNVLEGGSWESLLNFPAALIVLGGTFGAALLQTPIDTLRRSFSLSTWIFIPPPVEFDFYIKRVSEWAGVARKGGLLGLERVADAETNYFAKKALNLLVDGSPPQDIRRILEAEINLHEQREMNAAKVFSSMGGYAPTIGIIGAVMGLIHVMRNLADPNELGSGIAVAFVATIYGVALANLLFIPAANKLTQLIVQQSHVRELLAEGILYIAEGENPRSIEMKLSAYIQR